MTHLRLALVFIVALSSQAHAQLWNSSGGFTFNNPMSSLASTMITGNMMQQAMKDSFAQGSAAPAAKVHASIAQTDFKSNGKRIMVQPLIDAMTQTPEQRQTLGQSVTQVFAMYEARARKNNVAYAMAFMAAMAVAADKGVVLNEQQIENLALALNDQLAANPAFVKASALDRQRLYETFITMGSLIAMFNQVGKTDPSSAAAAKQLTAEAWKLLGLSS